MSPNHPPTIDLSALQDKLDDLAQRPLADPVIPPGDGEVAALAIETAANGNGHAAPGSPREDAALPAEPPAGLPVPRLGAEAAANMTKLSKAAAEDIRQLGRLAFDAGKRVQEECEQMARDVESNGGTVASHLTGLSQLLADVGMSNRETLRRLLGGTSPSIVPPAGNGHAAEQPAGTAKAMRSPPFGKPARRIE
jgi:hypothetical protein